jgi:hypothetical protein
MNFQARQRFPLLLQDVDNVVCGASAETDKDQFHGAIGSLLARGINDDCMAAAGNSGEPLVINPSAGGFKHGKFL